MPFQTKYDTTAKTLSAIFGAILVLVPILTHSLLVAGIGAAILLLSFAWSPRGYTLEGPLLIVHRLIGSVRIPLEGVRELRPARGDDCEGAIRLFASGGLFGYYGLFRTAKLGKCTWYVTDRSKAVVIVTGSKTILVSPDDNDGFLAAVRSLVPVPACEPRSSFQTLQAAANYSLIGPLIGGGVAVIVLAVVAFSFAYSPGPPGYTLTAQSLSIHDRFYPVTLQASDVDVRSIRVVNLDSDPAWKPTARTNGFANSHYRSGHFRTANGSNVLLYRADGRRLVLLPPKGNGTTVLLQTGDPEMLAADIRRHWGSGLP